MSLSATPRRVSNSMSTSRRSSAVVALRMLGDIQSISSHEIVDEVVAANTSKESYLDAFNVGRDSVVRKVVLGTILFTLWGALWTVVYQVGHVKALFPNSTVGVTVLGLVVSLILGYRTTSAYDRFWEARRVWGTMMSNLENMARFIWCSTETKGDQQLERERYGAIHLILAFAVAVKHYLRDEWGHNYTDLAHLLIHVPRFKPGTRDRQKESLPTEIVMLLSEYIANAEANGVITSNTRVSLHGFLASNIECLTSLYRIRTTPIPLAYAIHLKHIVVLYLLSVPFQVAAALGWAAIPVVTIASFVLLGIESLSNEIEQPFGYDASDLDLNVYCNELRLKLLAIVGRGQPWQTCW
ncbi:hypothetical protein HDU83_006618 [Entophlyctis luteolus]|nr:hypothetical protein HDU83_006618 [Entophlyctis luteolus]